jgi:hypothetical protein
MKKFFRALMTAFVSACFVYMSCAYINWGFDFGEYAIYVRSLIAGVFCFIMLMEYVCIEFYDGFRGN